MISLEPVTRDNFEKIVKLSVAASQVHFVASNENSIAKAYFDPESVLLKAIYKNLTPVGFIAFWCRPKDNQFHLLRFMIDANHQGRGYGKVAIQLLLDEIRSMHGNVKVTLYYKNGDGNPKPFYEKLGFAETGVTDDDENIMEVSL